MLGPLCSADFSDSPIFACEAFWIVSNRPGSSPIVIEGLHCGVQL